MIEKCKKQATALLVLSMATALATGCSAKNSSNSGNGSNSQNSGVESTDNTDTSEAVKDQFEGTSIVLSDDGITVDGEAASEDSNAAVYVGADIVYYEEGKDESYGEGTEEDAHSVEEAAKNTVVTITQPGEYKVSGNISYGQIAIDLGDDVKEDESAVVTLILDNANITCTVAPAIVVYNAYECGSDDTGTATSVVDTSNAGFNLVLADDSVNEVSGCHVAKIYKEGTTDKLHKYDAAIDSKVSFNINGETTGNGQLTVNSDNEGISSNLHMTVNGGNITINACDDSINTNEDGVSVFTMNGGVLICDSGKGSEGDGIDSNGWIVMNGGYVIASANSESQDSGVDSDNGILLNGGTVLATGNMYDEVSSESSQSFVVLNFNEKQSEETYILLKDSEGNAVTAFNAVNDYTMLVYSSPEIKEGDYTLYQVSSVIGDFNGSIYTNITSYEGEQQLQYTSSGMMGGGMGQPGGGQRPADGEMPEQPTDGQAPTGEAPEMPTDGQAPTGEAPEMPTDGQAPTGEAPEMPTDGQAPTGEAPEQPTDGQASTGGQMPSGMQTTGEVSTVFTFVAGSNIFSGISVVSE